MKRIFSPIPEALKALRTGRMLIVVDDPSRENQGDCVFAAETATLAKVRFIINQCKGQLCVPINAQKAAALNLPLMVPSGETTEPTKLQFTIPVDAKGVTSFGISAMDKLKTILTIANEKSKPPDFIRPGHVFPILEAAGNLLKRRGHTEATLALCRLSGFKPIGVLAEILDNRGQPADASYLQSFAKTHKLLLISIEDLVEYVKNHPISFKSSPIIAKISSANLPTQYGDFTITVFRSFIDGREHVALVCGDVEKKSVLARIHSQCLTGDTLGSLRCDCKQQLDESMKKIQKEKSGVFLYLSQEGRGIGLGNKVAAYRLQDKGLDTVEANHLLGFEKDPRNYDIAAQILKQLGISRVRLLTNNPKKISQISEYGIKVTTQPLEIAPTRYTRKYITTKKQKLGHRITKV